MTTATQTSSKAQPNEHGVTWADTKDGTIAVAVAERNGEWEVWGIYKGTHDLAPISRNFTGKDAEANARAYANQVWAR
jgi:hypothetical protein